MYDVLRILQREGCLLFARLFVAKTFFFLGVGFLLVRITRISGLKEATALELRFDPTTDPQSVFGHARAIRGARIECTVRTELGVQRTGDRW